MSSFRDGRMEMDELTATCEDGIAIRTDGSLARPNIKP